MFFFKNQIPNVKLQIPGGITEIFWIPASGTSKLVNKSWLPEPWNPELGTWNPELGTRNLEFIAWFLVFVSYYFL
jgi:hypothetical protein